MNANSELDSEILVNKEIVKVSSMSLIVSLITL